MPGKMSPPERRRANKLSRISSFTRRFSMQGSANWWLRRSSPKVKGRVFKAEVPPGSWPPSPPAANQDILCVFYAQGDHSTVRAFVHAWFRNNNHDSSQGEGPGFVSYSPVI